MSGKMFNLIWDEADEALRTQMFMVLPQSTVFSETTPIKFQSNRTDKHKNFMVKFCPQIL
jgi:hypothetical protein